MSEDMIRHVPFPFPDDRFSRELGAIVQRTVGGLEPAREVIHDEDNSWLVGDGVTDPNQPGATVATHIWHVIEGKSSVANLATLLLGHIASRTGPGHPWIIAAHGYPPDDEFTRLGHPLVIHPMADSLRQHPPEGRRG